jgi:Glycosyl transferase family 2
MVSVRKISVVIPYFNRAETLPRAIRSVRIQRDCRAEIIVVDDCSPVPPPQHLGDDVKVVRLPVNCGPGHARNRGAELAQHAVLAFLDADDEWFADKMSRQLDLLRPGTCVAGGVFKQNDESGDLIELLPSGADPRSWVLRGNAISPSTLVIHGDDHAACGGFPEERACAEDWVYIGRLLNAGIELAALDDFLAIMHRDGLTTTSDVKVAIQHALGAARLFREEALLSDPDLRLMDALVQVSVAQMQANSGAWSSALKHAARALSRAPGREVATGIAAVPLAGLRGSIRRRVSEPRLKTVRAAPLDPLDAGIDASGKRVAIVVPGARVPAWVNQVIEDLASSSLDVALGPDTRTGLLPQLRSRLASVPPNGVRRAGEPAALRMGALALFTPRSLRPRPPQSWPDDTACVVDLCGNVSEPSPGAWPPVYRVRFGLEGSADIRRGFVRAMGRGARYDSLALEVEANGCRRTVRKVICSIDVRSRSRTVNGALWKAAGVLARAAATHPTPPTADMLAPRPVAAVTHLASRLVALSRLVAELAGRVGRVERWEVALQPATEGVPDTDSIGRQETRWLGSRGEDFADPFVVEFEGAAHIFMERVADHGAGRIAVAPVAEDGSIGAPHDVLVESHHLSYPFVFRDSGAPWMIPESADDLTVNLYRSVAYPYEWQREQCLLSDTRARDATLHRSDDGTYWLWAYVDRFDLRRNDELWLFFGDQLAGPWLPHPLNPVVDDPRRARPAGPLLVSDGRLFRPSQDSLGTYGRSIVLNEVIELSRTSYRERSVSRVDPGWHPGATRTHTFSRSGTWQVLDAVRPVRKLLPGPAVGTSSASRSDASV